MHEARIADSEHGRVPEDDGWFILNAAEIAWRSLEGGGIWCAFEPPDDRSPLLGIGLDNFLYRYPAMMPLGVLMLMAARFRRGRKRHQPYAGGGASSCRKTHVRG